MANTFFGLSIGKAGLYTYQGALNTTAHNASNVDTKGYSRQQAIRTASQAISVNSTYGMAGTGSDISGIEQVRDIYYDVKYWTNSSVFGRYESRSYYMKSVEGFFIENESTEGITASFDKFNSALSLLSTNPSDGTLQTQVTEFASGLSEMLQSTYDGLQALQRECNIEIKNTADEVNSIAERISSLTKQINTIEVRGMKANDLRDARALLVDELSGLASVTVTETPMGEGVNINQYVVRIDGKTLVDTYNYTTLISDPQAASVNMNDVDGLYVLKWADGQNFDSNSPTLGGKLQALFETRDGNNKVNFTGTVTTGAVGDKKIVVNGANINDMIKLNIPETNGSITVGAQTYTYNSFEAKWNESTQSYTYTFDLKGSLTRDAKGAEVKIGEPIDAKGIPYFMDQLNSFVRTFSQSFNTLHKQGEDAFGNEGKDFFTADLVVSGQQLMFSEGKDFSSVADSNSGSAYASGSYYNMTAGNFSINEWITDDPKRIAGSKLDNKEDSGVEDITILKKLIALKSDRGMFKQGTPDMYLQTLVGEIGVDTRAAIRFADSQDGILKLVDKQRMAVSGVDSDEEGMDLIKFKNAYDLCSKVISVMNEIYDKLINGTGV